MHKINLKIIIVLLIAVIVTTGLILYFFKYSTQSKAQFKSCVQARFCISNYQCGQNGLCNRKNNRLGNCICKTNEFVQVDGGIQKIYQQDKIPHLSKNGKIIYKYGNDSIFLKGIYNADLGRYGSSWSKLNLNDSLSRDTLQQIVDARFDAVMTVEDGFNVNDLNRIYTFGLKTPVSVYSAIVDMNVTQNRPWDWAILKKWIDPVKTNPAILNYYLFDEDPHGSEQNWIDIYNKVKEFDPNHLQYAVAALNYQPVNNGFSTDCKWAKKVDYRRFSDIITPDIYTIHTNTKSLSTLTGEIDALTNSCQKNIDGSVKPFVIVLPAYQRTTIFSNGQEKYDPNQDEVMPTKEQLRGQIYASIIHGAVGYWIYTMHSPWQWNDKISYTQQSKIMNGISPETTADLWLELAKVNGEINTYKDVMLSPTADDTYHISVKQDSSLANSPLHAILRYKKEDYQYGVRYLLAINVNNAPITGKFSFMKNIQSIKIFLDETGRTNRDIKSSSNEFTDEFGPYAFHLYKLIYASS